MTKLDQTAASAFWQFSLDVYARPQVAELCLALQDEHNFDVNAVLFCLWSAQRSAAALNQSEIGEVLLRIAPINENLVHPVRGARRWVRRYIDKVTDSEEAPELTALYAALKAVELKSEGQVQSALIDLLRPASVDHQTSPESAAHASLEIYRRAIAAHEAATILLTQLVVRAFAPDAEPKISQT
ncbi:MULTISPECIES: TIGR02444 family protein [Hyphomonadaceae]|uniref:TIGR02444 family protein n=1 Tax=Hyphomonas oceanitis SCH89 TaxID=1280953 RepID=A0A059G2U0_9PROT|nr:MULTISPECIES: TIGR02444 family protein [Hyphomonadaceae]KDA00865.1 hypothetical protein HOC_18344 [Hyphomonas oceanitis SCH89]|tara:strand:+ start:2584 stop:3138 length:555 start_codon:yes stop_codon:yes gene_type:complete